jgi:hypothetical protein
MSQTKTRSGCKTWIAMLAAVAIVILLALVAVRLITGCSFGISTFVGSVLDLAQAVLDSDRVASSSQGEFTNVVFLHHSTGRNLIEQGDVRERFTAAGYDFWDHDYTQ